MRRERPPQSSSSGRHRPYAIDHPGPVAIYASAVVAAWHGFDTTSRRLLITGRMWTAMQLVMVARRFL